MPREIRSRLHLQDDHSGGRGDEAQYWLEVLVETETVTRDAASALMDEADQLVRITVASINTARGRRR